MPRDTIKHIYFVFFFIIGFNSIAKSNPVLTLKTKQIIIFNRKLLKRWSLFFFNSISSMLFLIIHYYTLSLKLRKVVCFLSIYKIPLSSINLTHTHLLHTNKSRWTKESISTSSSSCSYYYHPSLFSWHKHF